mgnify:CR=1 FL=1
MLDPEEKQKDEEEDICKDCDVDNPNCKLCGGA